MFRWLFHILAALSLLLAITSATLWVRSACSRNDYCAIGTGPIYSVSSYRGVLFFDMHDPRLTDDEVFDPPPNRWPVQYDADCMMIHDWFPVALFLVLPVMWGLQWRQRRRRALRRRGAHCGSCGYDLRAHLPGQKCPECGTVAPSGPTGAGAGG
jgi:hypothetical protein